MQIMVPATYSRLSDGGRAMTGPDERMTTLSPPPLNLRPRWVPRLVAEALLLLMTLFAALAAGSAFAQEPGERAIYREGFDAPPQGWSLDHGWTVDAGQLVGRDHRWARYEADEWSCDRLAFRFALASLKGTLHANFLVGDAGRYFVGFESSGRILDRVYLKKQLGSGQILDLGQSGPIPVLVTPQNPLAAIITCDAGRIDVNLGGKSVLNDVDQRPLPAGRVAFETLDASYAVIDDLAVTGLRPARLLTPDLRGLTVDAAERRHARLKLDMVAVAELPSELPPGQIIEQKPAPESPLPDNRRIEVWLSLGPELTPPLIGQNLDAAQAQYPRLKIDPVVRQASDRPNGEIIDQKPGAGRPLPENRRIEVWLSTGPEHTPKLVGLTLPAARMQHPDLSIEIAGRETNDRPAGEIVRQQPTAGRPLPSDGRIEVWLSQGPERTPPLVGLTLQAARTQHASLTIESAGRETSDRPAGEISRQKPEAGEALPEDHRIRVWMSAGEAARLLTPDLGGLSEAEARQHHPEVELRHVEDMDAASDAPEGQIVAQAPTAGDPLPADRSIRIGLSLGPQRAWTDSLPEIAIVTVIVGAIVLLRRLFRRRPPKERPAPANQPLRVRSHQDPGRQDIAAEGGSITLPALHLRCRADRGAQEIDYPRDRPEG